MAKDMKAALSKSVAEERTAFENRFTRAESVLGGEDKTEQPRETQKKPPKPKIIRDSFTIPEDDYLLIAALRKKCMKLGLDTNKGEIVRAGLKVLYGMKTDELRGAMQAVERVKIGRPKQTK